jgi:ferredoxin-type protein NapG
MADETRNPGRRNFVASCIGMAGSAGVLGLLLSTYSEQSKARPAWAIRPPGALPEEAFAAACVRCGLCVRGCPYDTLKLAELGDGVTAGTPYFVARLVPCEMCKDIPCVAACPTGALTKELTDIRKADMGVAVLTGRNTCYAVARGANCRACYLACPIKDEAISMERRVSDGRGYFEPTVRGDACTGCGKCEKACVTAEASIKVLPRELVRHDRPGGTARKG